ncbi:MAG TPA: hypothetical protein VGK46_05440 [Saprospiraceae bacterium]
MNRFNIGRRDAMNRFNDGRRDAINRVSTSYIESCLKIHRVSTSIRIQHQHLYIKGDGGKIEMQNGDYVDVSRRKKEEFIKLMRT